MELDGRISNKLLVGGIFAVFIFGLVGSQQAMAGIPAGPPNDIRIDKCVTFFENQIDTNFGEECDVAEGSVGSLLFAEEGDTAFFRIDAIIENVQEGGVSSVLVKDVLPAGLIYIDDNAGLSRSGNSYNPNTGVWDVGTINEGGTRSLIIEFKVARGTCGSDLENIAKLTSSDGTGDTNDLASATVSVEPDNGDCPVRDRIVEVHCESIFHRYSTSDLDFDGFTIIGGTGDRFDDGIEEGSDCEYTYASGFSETIAVTISGEFTFSAPGSVCDGGSTLFETHVSGTIILTDGAGNILVLNHEADLCRPPPNGGKLFESPGGTGDVDGGASGGIFARTSGTVETHRIIDTILDDGTTTVTGTIWVEFRTSSAGGLGEPPTIGMNMAGTKLIVTCGVAFDGICFNITSPYHEEFKLYEMMSGTHTISITMYCSYGVNSCNYAAIGIMPYSESIANTTWKIELYKDFEGNITTVKTDPEGFLGQVTVTTQILGDKFWVVSFTIDFKNKDTGPMKFGVQARDDNGAVRNWELNEGVMFIDSDAYPSIVTEFEEYLEIDSLCLNEDPTYRYSCAFAENRDRATQLAEDTLMQMLNGEYIYN